MDEKIKKAILEIPVFWNEDYQLAETDGLYLYLTNESEIKNLSDIITVVKFYVDKFKL